MSVVAADAITDEPEDNAGVMTTKERKEYEKRKKLKGTSGASNKQLGVKGFDDEDSDEEMKLEDGSPQKDKKKSKKFKQEELEGGIAGGEDGKKYKKEELKALENKKFKPEEVNAGIGGGGPAPSAPPAPALMNNSMEEQGMKERKTNKKLKEYETPGGATGEKKPAAPSGKKDA